MSTIRNRIDVQNIPMQKLNPPMAADRSMPIENNARRSRSNHSHRVDSSRLQVSEPPRPTNILRVDIEAGRFHTMKELTDFVQELDRRMRESDEMAILEDASPQQEYVLSNLDLTNTRIAG